MVFRKEKFYEMQRYNQLLLLEHDKRINWAFGELLMDTKQKIITSFNMFTHQSSILLLIINFEIS